MNFKNKVALVTGASGGIGRVIAQQFAENGARVLVHYRSNEERARQTLTSLAGEGHHMLQADLTRASECQKLIEESKTQSGRVDILVNNAGLYRRIDFMKSSFEEWQKVWQETLATNLFGPAHLTFLIAKEMANHGGGKIVNVSSRGAFRGEPHAPAYGASKAGLNALSQSLAQTLAPHNIFVHTVAPGFIETDMVRPILTGEEGEAIRKQSPLNRVGRADEVARTVLFLASEGTDYLTGCIIDINGASYLRT